MMSHKKTMRHERRAHSWHAYESPYRRYELFSPWTIVGLGLSFIVILFLVFPKQSLENRLAASYRSKNPDQLAIGYLEAFLATNPNSAPLRLNLARELIRMGSWRNAKEILTPLRESRNSAWVDEAAWIELDIVEKEAFSIKNDPIVIKERMDVVRSQILHLLSSPQTPERLFLLGQKALNIVAPDIALKVYQRLVTDAPELGSAKYADAAKTVIQLQKYVTASDLYFLAMAQSKEKAERRKYFMLGLRTLQAGTLYDKVITAADRHIGLLFDDQETLLFLITLAKAVDDPTAAHRYARRMLGISRATPLQEASPFRLASAAYVIKNGRNVSYGMFHRVSDTYIAQAMPMPPPPTGKTSSAGNAGRVLSLPYDEEVYKTAFETFLASGSQEDARLVAEAAVRQRPDESAWQRRYAELNEWTGRPKEALPHWLIYARMTGDEFGWDAVLRLASGLADRPTLKKALTHKLERDPQNAKILVQLAKLLSDDGDTQGAITLLRERLFARRRISTDRQIRREAFELLATLTQKAGQSDEAVRALQQMQLEYGPDSRLGLRIAGILYQRGKIQEAFQAIDAVSSSAAADDTTFWRNYTQLAQLTKNEPAAILGYQRLLGAGNWEESDLVGLQGLLQERHPQVASRVAAFGFNKTSNQRFALDTLTLMTRIGDWAGAQAFIDRLPADVSAALAKEPGFLTLRASVARANGRTDTASSDLREALQLQPDNMDLRAAVTWGLIAGRETAKLQQVLRLWAHDAESSKPLWGAFAAANMLLNRPAVALHWYRKQNFVQDDYLWLMSYAEALDATSQPELAWRVRRRVWQDIRRPEVLSKASPDELLQLRNRFAGMAPLFMNGDAAQKIVTTLLRADITKLVQAPVTEPLPQTGAELVENIERALATSPSTPIAARASAPESMESLFAPGDGTRPLDDARLSAGARETALAYAMSREADELARAWLATRFAGQLAKPLWAEFSLMLAADDRQGINRLLDDMPDWLPMLDRIEAAQRVGRFALAETLTYEQFDQLPTNDSLHERLATLTTSAVPTVELDTRHFRQSPLQATRVDVRVSTHVSAGTEIVAQVVNQKQSSTDPAQLPNVPATERELWLLARRKTDTGYLSLGVLHRDSDRSVNGLQVESRFNPSRETTLSVSAGYQLPATESALLRVGGMRSGAQATLNYQITRTEYSRLTLGWQRYNSQAGTLLGNGKNWIVEAGSFLRTDYPNIVLRAYASGISTSRTGNSDTQIAKFAPADADPTSFPFVPDGDRVLGMSVGIGTSADSSYTRAWRPFIEAGLTSSRVAGAGVNAVAGVAGSVIGGDVLRLRLSHISGTAANPGGYNEIGVDYKWYY